MSQGCGIVSNEGASVPERTVLGSIEEIHALGRDTRAVRVAYIHFDDEDLHSLVNRCRALEKLEMEYAVGISNTGLGHLLKLEQLRVLKLHAPSISDVGLETLSNINSLEQIELLAMDALLDDGVEHLAALPNLIVFTLHQSNISDESLNALSTIATLEKLDLFNGYAVTDAGMKDIAALPNLRELNIEGCGNITDTGLRELRACPSLRRLRVGSNGITARGIIDLSKAVALERLEVAPYGGISYEACFDLQARLDGCQILYDGQVLERIDIPTFWERWTAMEDGDAHDAGNKMEGTLPPFEHWYEALIEYLSARIAALAAADAARELRLAEALLVRKPFSDPSYRRDTAMLQLIPLMRTADERVRMYLKMNNILIAPFLNTETERFIALLTEEETATVRTVIEGMDLNEAYWRPVGKFVLRVADGTIAPPAQSKRGARSFSNMKRLAQKIMDATYCPICHTQFGFSERGQERCDACWEKSFDDWSEMAEEMERRERRAG